MNSQIIMYLYSFLYEASHRDFELNFALVIGAFQKFLSGFQSNYKLMQKHLQCKKGAAK